MTKPTKRRVSGDVAFESFYGELFGSRWPALRAALLEPVRHVAWGERLLEPYYLDAGSVEAALALPPVVSGAVLDMCAAPGGKTLILAGRLDAESSLTANEFSRERKNRLIAVLNRHLDRDTLGKVTVTGRDAARWSRYEQDAYDRILLDAPCSSERHVLSAPSFLAEWSPARVKNLASRQWALLSGAFLVLKGGGYLVYSTCALSPQENDGIVERLVKKYPEAMVCDPVVEARKFAGNVYLESSSAERTAYGRHVLPDTASLSGPLYYSLIRKKE